MILKVIGVYFFQKTRKLKRLKKGFCLKITISMSSINYFFKLDILTSKINDELIVIIPIKTMAY